MSDEWELVPDDGSDSEWELVPDDSPSQDSSLADYGIAAANGFNRAPFYIGRSLSRAGTGIEDAYNSIFGDGSPREPDWLDQNAAVTDQQINDLFPNPEGYDRTASFGTGIGKLSSALATGGLAIPGMVTEAAGDRYGEARQSGASGYDSAKAALIQGAGTALGAKIAIPGLGASGNLITAPLKRMALFEAGSVPMTYGDYLSRMAYTGEDFTHGDVFSSIAEQTPETLATAMLMGPIHRGLQGSVKTPTAREQESQLTEDPNFDARLDEMYREQPEIPAEIKVPLEPANQNENWDRTFKGTEFEGQIPFLKHLDFSNPETLQNLNDSLVNPDHPLAPKVSTEPAINESMLGKPDLRVVEPVADAPLTPEVERLSFERPATPEKIAFEPPNPEKISFDPAKVNTKSIHESLLERAPIIEQPLKDLHISEDVPNFKLGGRGKDQIDPTNNSQTRYSGAGTAPIIVRERLNGRREVVTGRNRRYWANNTPGKETLKSYLVKEADGFTNEHAWLVDAESNIRDGKGDLTDTIQYFMKAQLSPEAAAQKGVLNTEKAKHSFSLASNGTEHLVSEVQKGKISAERAATIADLAPGDQVVQRLAIDKFKKSKAALPGEYVAMMDAIKRVAAENQDGPAKEQTGQIELLKASPAEEHLQNVTRVINRLHEARDLISSSARFARGANAVSEETRAASGGKSVDMKAVKNTLVQSDRAGEQLGDINDLRLYPNLQKLIASDEPLNAKSVKEAAAKDRAALGLDKDLNREAGSLKIGQISGDIQDAVSGLFKSAAKFADSERGLVKLAPSERFMEGRMKHQLLPRMAVQEYRQLVAYPETIAAKSPEFKPIYESAQQRVRRQSETSADLHRKMKPYWDLEQKSRALVDRHLTEERHNARNAYVAKQKYVPLTPEQLKSRNWTPEMIAAKDAVRQTMDHALGYVGEALRIDANKIQDPELQANYINDVNKFLSVLRETQYVPFSRYGKGFEVNVTTKGTEKTGTQVLYRKFFDSKAEARTEYDKQKKANPNSDVSWAERASMRQDAYDDLPGQIVGTAKEFNSDKWGEAAKQRQNEGFTKHFIKAALTPGYETNMAMSMADYIMGLSKFHARKVSMVETDAALKQIDPDKKSEIRAYAKRYIQSLDKGTQYQTAVMNAVNLWTLAGVPMSAAVNLTQSVTTTYPALLKYANPVKAGALWSYAVGHGVTGGKTITDPQLAKGLKQAIDQGVVEAQAMNELRAFRRGDPTAGSSLSEKLMTPFKWAEKVNRTTAFVAGWKVAESQGVNTYEGKLKFAEHFVGETQFVNNQANLPEIARSVPGRIALQYKTSYVGQMLKFLRTQPPQTQAASLLALGMIGGIGAIPFMKEFTYAVEAWGWDPKGAVRKFLGDPKLASMVLSGVPTEALGVNMSGPVGLGELVPEVDTKAASVVKTIAGPAGDVFINRPLKSYDLYKRGQTGLALETIAPRFARGLIKNARIEANGGDLLDSKGRTVLNSATPYERALLASGATPTRVSEFNDIRDVQYREQEQYDKIIQDLNMRYRNANERDDFKEMDALKDEMNRINDEHNWNGKINTKPKREEKIPKPIREAVTAKQGMIRRR